MLKNSFVDSTRKKPFRERFFGDKAFYKMIFKVVIPIMVQNGITNFVNMLDNLMVGRIGTEEMSGVSIANQLIFIYNLCIFGGLSGIGIFTAQFYGKKDDEGIRDSVRAKLWLGLVLSVVIGAVFILFREPLLGLYLTGDGTPEAIATTLQAGKDYIWIIVLSFPAFFVVQSFAQTLRECGETMLPMKAGIVAVFVNLVFNYLLIYGKFGFPEMGVQGAAIATTFSRYVEAAIVIFYLRSHKRIHTWATGLFRTVKLNMNNLKSYLTKGSPILVNEALWSSGMAFLTQCYSTRGISVIAAYNIANTLINVCNVIFMAFGSAVGIIVGQYLGADRMQEAKDADNKLFATGIVFSIVSGILTYAFSGLFPMIYNTTDDVRAIATAIIMINAFFHPQHAFCNASYYTLRCGGKTVITFLFDCGSLWLVDIPLAFCLSRFTAISATGIFLTVCLAGYVKVLVGYIFVRNNIWIHNIVK